MFISFEFEGLAEIIEDVKALQLRLAKPVGLAKKIAKRLRKCFAENFNVEGRPEKWAALAASTLAMKQMLYDAGLIRGRRRGIRVRNGQKGSLPGILISSGDLKDSVAQKNAKGNVERITENGTDIEVGTSIPYGKVHDEGGEKAYTIYPKAGKMLAWFGIDRKTGQPGMIFTRGPVRHPPLARRSFLIVNKETMDLIQQDALELLTLGRVNEQTENN